MSDPDGQLTPRIPVAVIIVSDRGATGEREDRTAPLLGELLQRNGFRLDGDARIVADEREQIGQAIRAAAATAPLVLTSGGTGIGHRDRTVEATLDVIEFEVPGLGEAMRAASRTRTPSADLSRATAGVLGASLVVNLPGSPGGAVECCEVILPAVVHAVRLLGRQVADCQVELGRTTGPDRGVDGS